MTYIYFLECEGISLMKKWGFLGLKNGNFEKKQEDWEVKGIDVKFENVKKLVGDGSQWKSYWDKLRIELGYVGNLSCSRE